MGQTADQVSFTVATVRRRLSSLLRVTQRLAGMTIPGIERRKTLRIDLPFPVRVKGRDASKREFKLDAWLDNLSAGGFYLRLARAIPPGTRLFVLIRLSTAANGASPAPCVAARGVVLRSELQPDGMCGLAVAFTRYRFL